jgi:GNAT superfamily N-acetyltransferase
MQTLNRTVPDLVVHSVAEHAGLQQSIQAVDAMAYPPFMAHTDLTVLWPLVYAEFPEYQLVLRDVEDDRHLAHGNAVPFAWNGRTASLPRSAAEMVDLALSHRRRGLRPTALGALQAVVHPEYQRAGLSTRMLQTMAARAADFGCAALFAPIRPTQKERYPLAPLADYVRWRRADGQALDPWQRVHARLGATAAGIVPSWLNVVAPPADWTRWTGLVFPMSGMYVVAGALVPIEIDLEANTGSYREPHLWMHYRIGEQAARARHDVE